MSGLAVLVTGVVVLVGLGALAGTVIGVTADRSGGSVSTVVASTLEPSPEAPPRELPLSAADDGGELRIRESGFSEITDSAGEPLVTWGLVVENTSEVTMAAVGVTVDILDAGGESLFTELSDFAKERWVYLVGPGERAGIGDAVYVSGPGAADVTFRLGDVEWWPADEPRFGFAELTASEIELSREAAGGTVPYWGQDGIRSVVDTEGRLVLGFRVESAYDTILDRVSAQAIFRDDAGAIVGGAPPGDFDRWATVPPGWSIQRIRVEYGPPAQADLARTEVYVYPRCC